MYFLHSVIQGNLHKCLCIVVSTPNAFIAASCARDGKQKTGQGLPTLKPVDVADVFCNIRIKRTVSKIPTETHKVMEWRSTIHVITCKE